MEEKKIPSPHVEATKNNDVKNKINFFNQYQAVSVSSPTQSSPIQPRTRKLPAIPEVKKEAAKDDNSYKQTKILTRSEAAEKRLSIHVDLITSDAKPPQKPMSDKQSTFKKNRSDSFTQILKGKFKDLTKNLSTGNITPPSKEEEPASPFVLRTRSRTSPIQRSAPPKIEEQSILIPEEIKSERSRLEKWAKELKDKDMALQKKDEMQKNAEKQLQSKYLELMELNSKYQIESLNVKQKMTETEQQKQELRKQEAKILFGAYSRCTDVHELDQYLNSNFDPNIPIENGKTLLHIATIAKNVPFITYLLTNNIKRANPNIKDGTGSIPLHYAIKNQDLEATKVLLWREDVCISNPLTRDKPPLKTEQGKTPRDYLNQNNNTVELEKTLILAEKNVENIFIKVNNNLEEELTSLSNMRDRFLEQFTVGKKIHPGEESSLIGLLTKMIDGMYENISKTILLDEQKHLLNEKLKNFSADLQQSISIIRLPQNHNTPSPSPSASPKDESTKNSLKFGLLGRKKEKKETRTPDQSTIGKNQQPT